MKVDDYGRKIAEIKQESQKKIQDLKEDHGEIVSRKNDNLKEKVSALKSNQEKEIQSVQDRFDSEMQKMAKVNKEKFENFNKSQIEEQNELKDKFLNDNKSQRKEFQDRIGEINSSYDKDLSEQKKQSGIQLDRKDQVSNFKDQAAQIRHNNEFNELKDSTQNTLKSQQNLFARDKEATRNKTDRSLGELNNESTNKLNATKNDLNSELIRNRESQKMKGERSDELATQYKNSMGMKQNEKLERLMAERDRQTSEIQNKFAEDRKQILEETRAGYNQNLEAMERNFFDRSFKTEDAYREGIELRNIEKDNMKVKFSEKQKNSEKVFTDEINKLAKYQDQKMDIERENMKRESYKRDADYKQRVNEMRVEFNRELSKQRDASKEQLNEISTRYEEKIRNITSENARDTERKNLLQRQEIENIVANNNREKKDMIDYYETRLKNSGPNAKANEGNKASKLF